MISAKLRNKKHIAQTLDTYAFFYYINCVMINFNIFKSSKRKKTSKYIRKYGMTLNQIANKLDVAISTIHYWLNDPEKRDWLEKKINKK